MPDKNPQALAFMQTRRSRPAKTLQPPVPNRAELAPLLTMAARCPDHGKLEPWRFIVLERGALLRLAELVELCGARLDKTDEEITKARLQFADAHLAVAVIEVQKPSPKVPPLEQTYSAGAVCLSLLNAALAAGWGANWLSGWASHDAQFAAEALGLDTHERIAGFIHIGSETTAPPERPRPDMAALTSWVSE